MLKKKQIDGVQTFASCHDVYRIGLNTLQMLMFLLRLQKEWYTVTRLQYQLNLNADGSVKDIAQSDIDSDQCIKLLFRCVKMYEAKQLISKVLKMSVDRDRLASKLARDAASDESQSYVQMVKRLGKRIE